MPMWRCPHCGTPQAETARCWVCRRSSTTCSTCRHYRRAVVTRVGWCGLDRRRLPLRGDEMRGCWAGGDGVRAETAPATTSRSTAAISSRSFVPVLGVDEPDPEPVVRRTAPDLPAIRDAASPEAWPDRRTLFGEPES
jgi:hypothetical protein